MLLKICTNCCFRLTKTSTLKVAMRVRGTYKNIDTQVRGTYKNIDTQVSKRAKSERFLR